MLRTLRIENFVLIESLTLACHPGIGLVTGETGAGKSVVIEALNAALGGRVATDMVRGGAERAMLEATFQVDPLPPDLLALLADEGIELDISGEVTLSREVTARGSRCRLAGRLVNLPVLRRAGAALVDVLSQHEHQRLLDPAFHMLTLDRFGGLTGAREAAEAARERWRLLVEERRTRREAAHREAREIDFWRFQATEIRAACIVATDEVDKLRAERNRLGNAEKLRRTCMSAHERLTAGDAGPALIDDVEALARALTGVAGLDAVLAKTAERLTGLHVELHDVANALRDHLDILEGDPARLEAIDDRLDVLATLGHKYGPGLEAVLAHAEDLEAKLAAVESAGERDKALRAAIATAREDFRGLADQLMAGRTAAATRLADAVLTQLRDLELANVAFRVALVPPTGSSEKVPPPDLGVVEFMVAMNPGEPERALARSASGGELARVMLALATVIADQTDTPMLVLDEVDAGLSGHAAAAVAQKLALLARRHQVLCVTHLPAVAAMADWHWHLAKHVKAGRTRVTAAALAGEDRIRELARMASGHPAPAALRLAEELLARAQTYKNEAKPAPRRPAKARVRG